VAEVRDGRVFVKGRFSEVLNIGGGKVLPAAVEERLLEVSGVMAARVTGRRNSISGMIVSAEIVGASGMNEEVLRTAVILHCRACLPAFAVPRIIAFVDSLPTTPSGKLSRDCRVDI
jgi:acyl-coenzyme A synthetase/AMP-(fatty) acid ligase